MKRLLLLLTLISSFSFGQTPGGGVTDIDGNTYETVIIGSQEWMAENLRTTKYSNGDVIPNLTDNTLWSNDTIGAWCHFNNDNQYENPYGKLYNYFVAVDERNVCPTGWRIPAMSDYSILSNYLGGNSLSGNHLKSIDYWPANIEVTNSSGYTALPAGSRFGSGTFNVNNFGFFTGFWTVTEYSQEFMESYARDLESNNSEFGGVTYSQKEGFSLRCLSDTPVLGIKELKSNQPKELIKIVNLLGQEVEYTPNTVLIYQYSDGTSEKVFTIED